VYVSLTSRCSRTLPFGVSCIQCADVSAVSNIEFDACSIHVGRIVIVVYIVLSVVKYCTLILFRGHLAMY